MQFSSIQPIDRALLGPTTPGYSGPGAMAMKGVPRAPNLQHHLNSLSDYFVSYP